MAVIDTNVNEESFFVRISKLHFPPKDGHFIFNLIGVY